MMVSKTTVTDIVAKLFIMLSIKMKGIIKITYLSDAQGVK